MNTYKQKAFTLIELLVVIAIIGVLASVVLSSLNSARQKAKDAKQVAEISNLNKALLLYYDKYGSYPNREPWANINASGTPELLEFINEVTPQENGGGGYGNNYLYGRIDTNAYPGWRNACRGKDFCSTLLWFVPISMNEKRCVPGSSGGDSTQGVHAGKTTCYVRLDE